MSSNLWCAIDVGEKNVSRRPRARHSHLPASSQHDAMIFFSLPRRECHVQNPRRFGTRTSPNVSDDGDDVLKLRSSRVASRPHHNNKTAKRESGRNTKKFIHRTRDERSDKTRGAHRKTASALREFFDPSASCKDALFFMPPFSMSVISAGEKLTTTRVWGYKNEDLLLLYLRLKRGRRRQRKRNVDEVGVRKHRQQQSATRVDETRARVSIRMICFYTYTHKGGISLSISISISLSLFSSEPLETFPGLLVYLVRRIDRVYFSHFA